MYNPAPFPEHDAAALYSFIREHPLGLLVVAPAHGLEASHLPMFLDSDQGRLRAHMARANPQWRALAGAKVLAVFTGPQHYISPNWYPSKEEHGRVVPTWNYVAVHVEGTASLIEEPAALLAHLNELTDRNEAAVGLGWKVGDAPPDYIDALAKTIVGIEVAIIKVEGKWKVSQNRASRDRQGAIGGLEALGTPASLEMAELIRSR